MRKVFLLAVVAVLAFPAGASACTLAAVPAKKRVAEANVAVFGKVVRRTPVDGATVGDPHGEWRYRLKVLETYKGRVRRRMTLTAGADEAMCEAGLLERGDRFGLVLSKRRGPWRVTLGDFISRRELRSVRRPRRG